MRKKLLALLMCATMVLGTAVTASAYSSDDVTNAKKIVDQYDYFKAEFNAGKFNEETNVTVKFTTNYVNGANSIMYTYGLTTAANANGDFVTPVKLDKDGKDPLVKVADAMSDADMKTAVVDSSTITGVKQLKVTSSNPSTVAKDTLISATDSISTHYYYVADVKDGAAGYTLALDEVVLRTSPGNGPIVASDKIAKLVEYDPTVKTGTVDIGSNFQNTYGVDVDGYIPLKASTAVVKAYTTLTSNYYVIVGKSAKVADIAEALSNGTISKNAVAVDMQFYKLDTATIPNKNIGGATEYGFKSLYHCDASRMGVDVSVATDWLSRTNLKSASGVTAYILDENIPNVTNYFQRLGSVYKVADVVDGKFTADYVLSGTYIFDVAAATDNAGQADADKPAADKPAADTTSSPKTGDVAPIAALAFVMMGAFGAMVVASKKRA